MSFDRVELAGALARHGVVARVMIAAHKGSVPREPGASMLVHAGGQSGTIGGGALEYQAARSAFEAPAVQQIALGPAMGQCCGGAVTLVTERFDNVEAVPETGIYARQITGHAPRPARLAGDLAQATGLLWSDGWLAEPVAPARPPLWIWGAGHVGRALVGVLEPSARFDLTWIDTGPERFPKLVPQGVSCLPAAHPAELVARAPRRAHHLIVTFSHQLDLELCHRLLCHGFAQAGLIGSRTKWARFQARLRDLGHDVAQIAGITCPIGDPRLGKHPQAIAVGVAASLLSL